MSCGDIFRIIIALFVPPLGGFNQVGFKGPFWINLVIYLFAIGGSWLPTVFRHVARRSASRLVCDCDHKARKSWFEIKDSHLQMVRA